MKGEKFADGCSKKNLATRCAYKQGRVTPLQEPILRVDSAVYVGVNRLSNGLNKPSNTSRTSYMVYAVDKR